MNPLEPGSLPSLSDVQAFKNALRERIIKDLTAGRRIYVSTDYSPEKLLMEICKSALQGDISFVFPCKTHTQIRLIHHNEEFKLNMKFQRFSCA